ncbi:MAG: Uncharacterised protein [Flavobacterium sp. SCGC AAA160-P02]|nr:MAG: Uncharacterised protein [Flavobacterium sp. SCGC AAA160-P02]|tara:strand:+ start:279 stop:761 length:483 start_codon:yes stop_codon:yes gene_type:complete
MKYLIVFFVLAWLLLSCTSNTIYEKPKDLIPKDTMILLLKDLYVATSAKAIKNINQQKKISYISLVYDTYNIDSLRFRKSSLYYTSEIDEYEPMLNQVMNLLEKEKAILSRIKKTKDSVINESVKKKKEALKEKSKRENFEKIKFSKNSLKKRRVKKKST